MHLCHNPNCGGQVKPQFVAHRSAWYALPPSLRYEIWQHYRPGQEVDKKPSREYADALRRCVLWWRSHGTKCRETSAGSAT